ncbi:MAG: flagellar basal body-associated FliL family protein [Alphaproteobacteria bacterium]|nr:flagellar basal body-associated FliL family protein [Alphaproteobacteria bacterium]
MSDASGAVAAAPSAKGAGKSKMLMLVAAALLAVGLGGGAYWFLVMSRAPTGGGDGKAAESPLPFTVAVKPFVVSMAGSDGTSHFVQLGVNLQVPGAHAGDVVTTILPQLQDAMRQTVLTMKSDDLQTVPGINKMRAAMLSQINEALGEVLGTKRVTELSGGDKIPVVQNIFFTTLIVE